RIHDETGVTTVFVTHDQEEALDLADRVVVLKGGEIEQIGEPLELYRQPKTAFVFDFLGHANQAQGNLSGSQVQFDGFSVPAATTAQDGQVTARFRPFDSHVSKTGPGFAGKVLSVLPAGANLRLEVRLNDGTVYETQHAHDSEASQLRVGDAVFVLPSKVYVFD
ncbi:MAG TPA: TOBE-like domain-containing protein, partial [Asticcacaulis sp.]|nr:TOBE-like domain-containing protein [Asticcacaulis sp.]